MLRGSRGGGTQGAALLWLQAGLGATESLCKLDAVEELCALLAEALVVRGAGGPFALQAAWAAAALWRLCYNADAAAR
eukprot:3649796-Pleurochrysis_carterae.AAC.1